MTKTATNMETTTTQRGRNTKVPSKFQQNGSLGAAVGGGGLSTSTSKLPLLPGITGATPSVEGDAATNHQSEGGGSHPLHAPPACSAPKGKGKAKEDSADRKQAVAAIMQNSEFGSENDDSSSSSSSGGEDSSDTGDLINVDDSGDSNDSSRRSELDVDGRGRAEEEADSGGGSGGGSSKASGSGTASGGVATSKAKAQLALRKSIDRNREKPYEKWPVFLLREACATRKVQGFSKSSDVQKMAGVLTQVDSMLERSSPFLLDLDDKAAGGTPASRPPASGKDSEDIPEQLVTATRAALEMGASFASRKLLTHQDKSYPASAVLALVKEQQKAEGGGEEPAGRRKSKHCVPRFCEIVAENLDVWFGHRQQLTKTELDNKFTSKTRPALVELWGKFKDKGHKVPFTFADDDQVLAAGIDPNIVHQPNITFEKFLAMKHDLIKDHGDMYINYKKSGSHDTMMSFCKGSLETYYYGMMCEKYPGIEQATTSMLPDGTGSENTGVRGGSVDQPSGAAGAKADAIRRDEAKKSSKERNSSLGAPEKKQKKKEKDMQEAARIAANAATQELGLGAGIGSLLGVPPAPSYADAPTSFYDTIEGCETKSKQLELMGNYRRELKALKEQIKEEQEDSNCDEDFLQKLKLQVKQLKAAITQRLSDCM